MLSSLVSALMDILFPSAGSAIHQSPVGEPSSQLHITLQFEDGMNAGFSISDEQMLDEYISLKLMWHANFDQPELIPYVDKPFECTMEWVNND